MLERTTGASYRHDRSADVLLYAAVVADLHTDGDPERDRNHKLRKAFAGISAVSPKLDALIFAGDITNSAAECEYINLRQMMTTHNRIDTVIPAMGNHDSRGTSIDPDFDAACKLFHDFCTYTGIKADKNYFSAVVNGFRLLVMGTEALLQDEAYISQQQLSWLDRELASASAENKPVFVICHQPLKGTVPGIRVAGHLGEQSDKVKAVIEKHTKSGMTVVLFSGHIHSEFSANTLTQCGNLWCVDLPALQYSAGDEEPGGDGVTMEVYSDKILLRAINFITGARYEDYNFEIPLV